MTEPKARQAQPGEARVARFPQPAPGVSLVVPIYNEQQNLKPLAREITAALATSTAGYEVLFVDDGSTDGSVDVLRELAARDSRLRPVFLPRHAGQSAALSAGFAAALGGVVVTLDADLQNDPADIPTLLSHLEDADLVSGIRTRRNDTWVRRLSSAIANRVRRTVLGDSIQDIGCSLKAYRAPFLEHVPDFDGMHRFLPALVQLAGARVIQVPVNHRARRHGHSKYGVNNRLWRGLVDLWAVRWMVRRDIHRAPRPSQSGPDSPTQ
jgi:dolichol-phosphate mannosyltransferase